MIHKGGDPHLASWWLKIIKFSPLHIFWAGHEAVLFFFVLSGFVLSLPYLGAREAVPYWLYLTKRILRIYPPYFVAVCCALVLRESCYDGYVPGCSVWFNEFWKTSANWKNVQDHLLLIGSFDSSAFNPVLWSLVHEMRVSIFFPVLIWLVRDREKTAVGAILGFDILSHLFVRLKNSGMLSNENDYDLTLHYAGIFIIGCFLAKYRGSIVRGISGLGRRSKLLILVIALLLYANQFWLPYYAGFGIKHLVGLFRRTEFQEWITTAGVVAIISLSLGTRTVSSFLSWRVVSFLGRISYSLYLFHAICLIALVHLMHSFLPLWCIEIVALGTSLLVSTLSYDFVENPSIRLGRYLTRRRVEAKAAKASPQERVMKEDEV